MELGDNRILNVHEVTVSRLGKTILRNISFDLNPGDHLAIIGASGSGKTTLGFALSGQISYKGEIRFADSLKDGIIWIEQQHHFKNLFNTNDLYYQQRFNSYDSEQTITVEESLKEFREGIGEVLHLMKIEYLATKPLIQLSNGENKKLQIAKALLAQPSVLIMDQPFIGLDQETRNHLHEIINQLASQNILIILTTSAFEIPECITKVLTLEDEGVRSIENKKTFVEKPSFQKAPPAIFDINKEQLRKLVPESLNEDFKYAIRMKNVNVGYGEKTILKNINWGVKKRERWLLCGPNGAGKSTLLSLVTADNPQAYANEIYLFDKRRGTGESIWDIKKKIGYLSPELHLFFDQASTCFETVASGLFDTIGLFRKLSDDDIQQVYDWIEFMGLTKLCDKRLYQLSTGEQRMVLLARAFVKNPPMLILDEPCQGIDHERQSMLLQLINEVCLAGNKTLVFVTHYHDDKPGCIDLFLNLDEGQISGSGLF